MIILQLFIPNKIQATSNAPSITLSPSLVFPPDSSRSFSLIKKISEIPLDTGSSFAPPCQPCPTWAPKLLASISCGKAQFSSHMWWSGKYWHCTRWFLWWPAQIKFFLFSIFHSTKILFPASIFFSVALWFSILALSSPFAFFSLLPGWKILEPLLRWAKKQLSDQDFAIIAIKIKQLY